MPLVLRLTALFLVFLCAMGRPSDPEKDTTVIRCRILLGVGANTLIEGMELTPAQERSLGEIESAVLISVSRIAQGFEYTTDAAHQVFDSVERRRKFFGEVARNLYAQGFQANGRWLSSDIEKRFHLFHMREMFDLLGALQLFSSFRDVYPENLTDPKSQEILRALSRRFVEHLQLHFHVTGNDNARITHVPGKQFKDEGFALLHNMTRRDREALLSRHGYANMSPGTLQTVEILVSPLYEVRHGPLNSPGLIRDSARGLIFILPLERFLLDWLSYPQSVRGVKIRNGVETLNLSVWR